MTTSLTRLYRVVSEEEYLDLELTGRFRATYVAPLGKWFCDSLEGAVKRQAQLYPGGDGRIVAADVAADLVARSHRDRNLDLAGPATFIERDDLKEMTVVLEVEHG